MATTQLAGLACPHFGSSGSLQGNVFTKPPEQWHMVIAKGVRVAETIMRIGATSLVHADDISGRSGSISLVCRWLKMPGVSKLE